MILAKLQCESRKYRKITIYWVGGREQTLYAGVEFPKNRPGQESKELASKTRQERSKLAPGLSLQGDKSPTLTFLAPGLLARRPAEVRPSAPLSLLESVAVRRLEPVGRTHNRRTPGTGHDGLQDAGWAHLGERLSPLVREIDVTSGLPSTSPPSPVHYLLVMLAQHSHGVVGLAGGPFRATAAS
jgi:hypothetical protein